ncbi:hypothetical protein Y032_0135g1883 [Ancylostoma ceylanicum]|uniref:Choline/ethanolamine kinase n=2 Tax=Ancylostoma ceylanicum TaxID=53326 RepID=A0A016T5C0_9BILA|nr:hypothetical protein Y032_0135g1883 [Ancylostoma ceylanicum]
MTAYHGRMLSLAISNMSNHDLLVRDNDLEEDKRCDCFVDWNSTARGWLGHEIMPSYAGGNAQRSGNPVLAQELFSKFDPSNVDSNIVTKARSLCAHYVGGAWRDVDNSQFLLSKMSGGLTNLVFVCSLAPEVPKVGSEPRSVLLRIQTQTDTLQLMREIAVFTVLSAHGYGPKLLGVFSGGRIEEFIPSRTLTTEEMSDARFAPSLATLNAKLNNIEMPLPKSPQLVFLCRSWLAKYVSNGGGSLTMEQTAVHGHVEFPKVLTVKQLEEEINEVERFLEKQEGPSVFCHNDIVPANVLLRNAEGGDPEEGDVVDESRLVIIDFEFGCYNHRAHEIANNLDEYGMTYGLPTPPYYDTNIEKMEDEDLARRFCSAYLDQLYKDHDTPEKLKTQFLTGNREKDLKKLMAEGRRYLALPHLLWGLWNLLCDQDLGMVEGLDFLTHAKDRLIMYFRFKSNMYKY